MMFDMLPVLVLSAVLAGPAALPAMPLKLEVATSDGMSVIKIVGESAVACSASYQLQVSDNRGGNRSTTAGNVKLQPGVRQTLATVALGPESARSTIAKLDVQPCGGAAYQQAWPAPHS